MQDPVEVPPQYIHHVSVQTLLADEPSIQPPVLVAVDTQRKIRSTVQTLLAEALGIQPLMLVAVDTQRKIRSTIRHIVEQ